MKAVPTSLTCVSSCDGTALAMAPATRKTFLLLVAPSAVLLAFFILPLTVAVVTSFEFPDPFRHYRRLMNVPVYQAVYLRTLRIAFLTTLVSFFLAYPCAYYIARLSPKARTIAVLLITVPFML